jgi:CheY-like chemotaxis protein
MHPYLLFHSFAELVAATISFGTFLFAWNTRRYQSSYLITLGAAALFVGVLGTLHCLAFPGMSVFPAYDANLSPQLWMSARFLQASACVAGLMGGLGLGLALVKGLVEQHGGSVEAQSAGVGQGAEFTIRLPLEAEEPTASEAAPHVPPSRRVRVLVIEDNLDAADSLCAVLELCGHDASVAHSGTEGVATARVLRPDVIFCDIGLPGMDGYAVARAIRSDDGLRATRLVALTGYGLPEDLQRAAEAGFEQHITKPPTIETLEGALLGAVPTS